MSKCFFFFGVEEKKVTRHMYKQVHTAMYLLMITYATYLQIKRVMVSYIAVNFHPEVRIYWKTLPLAGRQPLSHTAVNFHSQVRIYWKTVPLAGQQSLFLHCSKVPSWSENLFKNLTICRVAVSFLHFEKPYLLQGGSHFLTL